MSTDTSAVDDTVALIARSGLLESPPGGLTDLCGLAVELLPDAGAGVEVHLRTPEGALCVARAGGAVGAGTHDVPLVTGAGVQLGFLRVTGERPDASAPLSTLAQAVATACDLEMARTRLFDAEEETARLSEQFVAAAGQVVHDLNNPLAAAAMSLEIAREQVEEGLVAQLLDRAVGSAEKMKRMTTSLLTFVHEPLSDRGAARADVGQVLGRLVEEFAGLPVAAVTVEGDLPQVAMAPADLEVVLVALLENAVKFADEERDLEVSVRAEQVGDRWRVTFRDNGRGIAAEDLERIFEPTVRLDRRIPGMGLGLPTVRRLVRSAGGDVGAVSTPDAGTEVWFELPV